VDVQHAGSFTHSASFCGAHGDVTYGGPGISVCESSVFLPTAICCITDPKLFQFPEIVKPPVGGVYKINTTHKKAKFQAKEVWRTRVSISAPTACEAVALPMS
jgi:hypothetical protein